MPPSCPLAPYNARVEQRAAVLWMLALYPSRVCSNALLGVTPFNY
jgi:hypothetical protein